MRPGRRDVPGGEGEPEVVRSGVRRLLPAGLLGPGRRPSWRRTRLRRVVSAALVAAAAWLALSAFLPQPAPRGVPIVVVGQDLMPGHVLTAGDLAVADWPKGLIPGGAFADPTDTTAVPSRTSRTVDGTRFTAPTKSARNAVFGW